MSKTKQISYKNTINKISRKTALKVENFASLQFEKFNNWIPAGTGKKYRDTCNKIRYELKCKNDGENKQLYQHCNKLDCKVCFITSCSARARKVNERLKEFRRISYANGIEVGRMLHFSIIFYMKKDTILTFKKFVEFKRKILYPMLRNIGIFAGVVFLHVWSNICTVCGEKEYFSKGFFNLD